MKDNLKKMPMGLQMRIAWEPERKRQIDICATLLQLSKIDFVKFCVDYYVEQQKQKKQANAS